MQRTLLYAIEGCFAGTIITLLLYKYQSNPFLLFLIPMWGAVLGLAIARVVDLHKEPKPIPASRLPKRTISKI